MRRAFSPLTVTILPQDQGGLVTPTIGANLVHTSVFSFGLYLQATIPIDVDLAKFSNPRARLPRGRDPARCAHHPLVCLRGAHLPRLGHAGARSIDRTRAWR